jgi:hypothetical protein
MINENDGFERKISKKIFSVGIIDIKGTSGLSHALYEARFMWGRMMESVVVGSYAR